MIGRTLRHGSSTHKGAKKSCVLFHTFYIFAAMTIVKASMPQTTAFVTKGGGQNNKLQSDIYNQAAAVANCGWRRKGMPTASNKSINLMLGLGRSYPMIKPTRSSTPSWLLSTTSTDAEAKSSPVDDEDEWRTVLAAFQMYKAAYGDLKVPSRFVVPGMAPWPGKCETIVTIF